MREKIASLAAVVFSLGVASSASAADLTTTAPYTAADTVFSWSGAYVGLHAGYSWGANRWTSGGVLQDPTIVVSPVSPATNSALGGVQAGANYQTGNWVVGFEWDFAVLGHKSSAAGTLSQLGFVFPTTATSKLDWLTQFTGRAGFAARSSTSKAALLPVKPRTASAFCRPYPSSSTLVQRRTF